MAGYSLDPRYRDPPWWFWLVILGTPTLLFAYLIVHYIL